MPIHEFQVKAQSSLFSVDAFVGYLFVGFFVFLPYSLLKWFIFCSVANSDPLFHKVSMMLSIKSP